MRPFTCIFQLFLIGPALTVKCTIKTKSGALEPTGVCEEDVSSKRNHLYQENVQLYGTEGIHGDASENVRLEYTHGVDESLFYTQAADSTEKEAHFSEDDNNEYAIPKVTYTYDTNYIRPTPVLYDYSTSSKVKTPVKSLPVERLTVLHEGSSVWCQGKSHTERRCHFRNLCYLGVHDSFVFVHSEDSVIHGVPLNRFDPDLLDASTVTDHNTLYFNYVDLPLKVMESYPVKIINEPTIVFKRFNPGNLMHVFHDDLIPLYHTIGTIFGKPENLKIRLLFADNRDNNEFDQVYQLFSNHSLIFRSLLKDKKENYCFRDAYVGLSKDSVWYQYGFFAPQGPVENISVTGTEIRNVANFISKKLKGENIFKNKYIVLLSRKENRFIINEVEVLISIAQDIGIKVISISLETHSIDQMIVTVQRALGIVGMHGSLLTLVMFLPPGSFVIELFPFAVNPDNYTPFKTLCNIKGMNLVYKSWRNYDFKRTREHASREPSLGGIRHLPKSEQNRILGSKEVPKHLCCKDPEWLFRIYQDTEVDSNAVTNLIKEALTERDLIVSKYLNNTLSPAPVTDLQCVKISSVTRGVGLQIIWEKPWNLKHLKNLENLKYEVMLQEQNETESKVYTVDNCVGAFFDLKGGVTYNVWVRAIVGHVKGPYNDHFDCYFK